MTAELEELTRVASELPPELVTRVLNYARMLKLAPPVADYDTDDPTEEELRAVSNRDMQQFEEEHGEEDWGDLKPMNPGERYK